MKDEKIVTAWNRMNPDSAAKEKMFQQIQSSLKAHNKLKFRNNLKRFALGFAAVFILLLGSFGTAYAASPAFRDYVHSLLFPLYTSDEFVSIDNGHLTGAFDKTDVLLTFLDRFNRSEFGNSITAAKADGYRYSLFTQDENQLLAFVDSSLDGYCIVVYMERLEYDNTDGIWQITGYQLLETAAAETAKSQLAPYSEPSPQDMTSTPQEGTSIKGTETSVIIYNVNAKKNVASLEEDDSRMICDILNNCEQLENIEGGLFQYVIKTNDATYLFDSRGNGMIAKSADHQGIVISEKELAVMLELFERYGISLEEKN